ncbi:glycoside hydrolase family 32 protein [Neokomagataea thailandica]|uniref:Levanase n=1 Tax=Neokomagataea tanensis NBRC 106556 TaxID=1223519 RepID=A0ABQ0QIV5_9PROT|nr:MULTISPECIES: glycoside hydrolase family 32 protein [Neokomagataea]GBR46410.1 levanase [Neokomagataea tanensis NBRC 106556]
MSHLPFRGDPQPILKVNGTWHFYYLYNVDFPTGNGTAWKLSISLDLIHWHDAGIAIPKYTTPYGDPWSGSLIIDHDNRAGLGQDTIIALCTMPMPDGQGTARWFSKDGGKSFTFDRAVMTNPLPKNTTIKDKVFRDPRVTWMEKEQCWVMSLAEIGKIGFYRSSNLTDWSYLSGFMCDTLGTLECPTLFPIIARDSQGRHKGERWILLCSANGYRHGFTTGAHYWVGHFDGYTFQPDEPSGQWLDGGSDFYACAIWGDHTLTSHPQEHYYAIAWKNNWDYATQLPPINYYGSYTRIRTLTLQETDAGPRLTNNFIASDEIFYNTKHQILEQRIITPENPFSIPLVHSDHYAIQATITPPHNSDWPHDITLTFQSGMGTPFTLILSPSRNNVNLKRDHSGFAPSQSIAWTAERNAPLTFQRAVTFTAIINSSSIEIIFNDGMLSLTSLAFPQYTPATPRITVSERTCLLRSLTITNAS